MVHLETSFHDPPNPRTYNLQELRSILNYCPRSFSGLCKMIVTVKYCSEKQIFKIDQASKPNLPVSFGLEAC